MKFEKGHATNYKISGIILYETENAIRIDSDGDIMWLPKSQIYIDDREQTIELPEWLFKNKFPNE